ncbi:hypothetical protein ES703_36036 [subsurface metagenome]
MISESIIGALRTLSERLKNQNVRWVFVGSISLALQGVDVTPGDIDILTDKAGAYKINELLKDCEAKPVKFGRSDMFQSHLGEFCVNDVKVEVMGDYQEKIRGKWQDFDSRLTSPVIIHFGEMQLPVSLLRAQLRSYKSSGREQDVAKVAAIRAVLRSRETAESRNEA